MPRRMVNINPLTFKMKNRILDQAVHSNELGAGFMLKGRIADGMVRVSMGVDDGLHGQTMIGQKGQ